MRRVNLPPEQNVYQRMKRLQTQAPTAPACRGQAMWHQAGAGMGMAQGDGKGVGGVDLRLLRQLEQVHDHHHHLLLVGAARA